MSRNLFFLLIILGLVTNAPGSFAGEPEKKLVLSSVKAAGEALTSLQAKMKQRKISSFMEKEIVTKADFYYQKPGKYALDPSSKSENQYIIVGTSIWIINDQNKTVTKTTNSDLNFGQYLMGLGSTSESLEKLFELTVGSKQAIKKIGMYHVELVPKKNTPLYGKMERITIEIRDDLWLPSQARLIETDGDETIWEFSDYKINPKINDSVFKQEAPKGYQVKQLDSK